MDCFCLRIWSRYVGLYSLLILIKYSKFITEFQIALEECESGNTQYTSVVVISIGDTLEV